MKKLILFSCFVFALTLALTACSNSDDEIVIKSDLTSEDLAWNNRKDAKARLPYGVNGIMQTASVSLTPKSGLPAWIVPIVNQFEKDDPMKYTALFSCQWDGRTVYFIYSLIQSSLFSETYDISGEKIQVWGEGIGTMEDFMRTSTDWKLLYCTDVSKWIVTTLGE